MAHGTKGPAAQATASPTNGPLTSSNPPPGAVGVNRKKQKRRAKQAAKAAEQAQKEVVTLENGHVAQGQSTLPQHSSVPLPAHQAIRNGAPDFDDADLHDPAAYDEQYFTDDDGQVYDQRYSPTHPNGNYSNAGRKKPKKKKKARSGGQAVSDHQALASPPPLPSSNALRSIRGGPSNKIWNTSTQEERENIKEFWLSLGEDERKSLVKIEKEAVLRKMKEQQKHSCSCTVCGRKRTAIEEELEVLYDAYYEELEQYANHQQPENGAPIPLPPTRSLPLGPRSYYHPPAPPSPLTSRHHHDIDPEEDEEDEEDDDGESEEYSDEEDDEEDYSDGDVEEIPRGPAADFFNFGNSLTVKGGILTVADDLLKNDGKKFIEMMEQLAERRMARENEAQYRMNQGHPNSHHNHGPPPEEDEYDDEEEEEYDSVEDEEYDEEDDMDSMTEEQRMEEGRRMFQIFAARMFEQRVLTAYREKVARERQQKLLEELDDEDEREKVRQEKKARDAARKKEKKRQQQQAKAEEKAKKEAEKAEQERQAKAAEEKRLEEQRRKKEEQRRKREAERKAQDEERQRKEAEKQKRLKEERERHQEVERKAREQKALEKQAREDAKRREREDKEAREREAREKKLHDEKVKKDRERDARGKADHTGSIASSHGHPKRSQPPVALPPQLLQKQASTGLPSPLVQVATPVIPKAPTPNRPRQSSQQGSHGSSPKTPHVSLGNSKSQSPATSAPVAPTGVTPKTILQKPPSQPSQQQSSMLHHPQPSSPMPPIGPPPGMHPAPGAGFGMPPPGINGFPTGMSLPGIGPRPPMGHNIPQFPHNTMNSQFRPFGLPGSIPPPPPGMTGPPMMQHGGRGMPLETPQGFPTALPGMAPVSQAPGFANSGLQTHSRQQSASFDPTGFDPAIGAPGANPIQRPAPIQRPSSVKPGEFGDGTDIDDLSRHLGSSALLDDADDIPNFDGDGRGSGPPGGARHPRMPFSNGAMFPPDPNAPRLDSFGLPSTGPGSAWSTPSLGGAFGPVSASGWGSSPTSLSGGLFNNAFGAVMNQNRPNVPRPQYIRLLASHACKNLSAMKGPGSDGFHDVAEVLQHTNRNMKVGDATASPSELLDIFETEGDEHNGGGLFLVQDRGQGKAVKFEEGTRKTRAPSGLGEIGSPVPGHSIPVGFGAPRPSFPGLGV